MKPIVLALSFAGLGACVSAPSAVPLEARLELPGPAAPGLAATVTHVVDLRPDALRHSRTAFIESHYSVLIVASGGAFVDGARIEGPTYHSDETLRLSTGGKPRTAVEAVSDLVAALTGGGAPVAIDAGRARHDLDGAVASVPGDGWVLVPVLDQLDVCGLSSENSMVGSSSYESSPTTTTTTSGAAFLAASVGSFANARVRLYAAYRQGGAIARRFWIHGRGVGPDLGTAWHGLADSLAQGLAEVSR